MCEILEWAEKSGIENMKFRLQNAETLAKEAASTLTVVLAGMGGAMAYAIKVFEQPVTSIAVATSVLTLWLMFVASVLVVNCMLSADLPAPTNEPMNLYQKDFTLDQLKTAELKNLDDRIKQVTSRNHRIAAWLDRSRLLAIASPVVFVVALILWAAVVR